MDEDMVHSDVYSSDSSVEEENENDGSQDDE